MIFSIYYTITMEETSSVNRSSSSSSSFPLCVLVDVLLIHMLQIFNLVHRIQKFIPRFHSLLQSKLDFGSSKASSWPSSFAEDQLNIINRKQQAFVDKKVDDGNDGQLSREDVEMVMVKLGIFCSPESGGSAEPQEDWFSCNNISGLFEAEEPSLEEVKEAFDVFDQNRDGFIDAEELQRVLCILGLKQGSHIQDCKTMIGNFDQNKDGRIDFNEFVKLMESSFC